MVTSVFSDDRAAVVEDPAADPHAQQPPERGLERRAVEDSVGWRGAASRTARATRSTGRRSSRTAAAAPRNPSSPLHQHEVDDGERRATTPSPARSRPPERVVEVGDAPSQHGQPEDVDPPGQQEQRDRAGLCRFFGGQPAAQLARRSQLVEPASRCDRARDLEAGRTQQPDALPDLARRSGPSPSSPSRQLSPVRPCGRVGDAVAEEVVAPDRHPGRRGTTCSSSRR